MPSCSLPTSPASRIALLFNPRRFYFNPRHGMPNMRPNRDDFRASCKTRSIARLPLLAALNAAEFRKSHQEKHKDEEDDDLCPVDCVREFRTNAELTTLLETAKQANTLVVVDFYRTACGSCKYIEQGFVKLCKGAGDDEASVIFLKHNVMDEYEEQSEVAEMLKIKVVPLFHFYKDGQLVEAFPTREKTKILETIRKYTSSSLKN